MPNWCSNNFQMVCKSFELFEKVKKALGEENLCVIFCPIPPELNETTSPTPQEIAEKNIERYGYASWYEFCYSNWGTKWDICESYVTVDECKLLLEATFDTAWGPPIELLEKLYKENKENIQYIFLEYFEPMMDIEGTLLLGEVH